MRTSTGRARWGPAGALILVLALSGGACNRMSEDEAAPAPGVEITGPCDAPGRWSGVSGSVLLSGLPDGALPALDLVPQRAE
ncbi:MAG: hypothetical protein ABI571_06475, partial [Actinomycetota bacterium]